MPPMNYMAGKAIGQHFAMMQQSAFAVELVYSFVIILASLMIFYSTREMYKLTKYKGLKYFRFAFLFFAIAYFFRYVIRFIIQSLSINQIIEFSSVWIGSLTLFIFMYSSSIAIFYLLYSLIWKRLENNFIYALHILAVFLALIMVIIPSPEIYLSINLFLFVFVLIIAYISHKSSKKNSLFIIYILLLAFWILNIIDIFIPRFLFLYKIYVYLASITIFMIILYKVLKKAGVD
jgi:hypothetical protein